jgi:hypothetical protein
MRTAATLTLLALAGCGQEYNVSSPVNVDPNLITECPFSPVPGTRFQRYDCNPVFTGSDEEWATSTGSVGFHVEEVLGHAFYQMWYATGLTDGTGMGIGYAISTDGTSWESLPTNPGYQSPSSGWNRDSLGATAVVWDSNADQYVMAYQGVNYDTDANGLGMLVSEDGRTWSEANDGEMYVNLSADVAGVTYCWPLSLAHDPELGFRGYIGGSNAGPLGGGDICEVYYYGGPDLQNIRPDNDAPVLRAGQGVHDQKGVANAAVVELDGTWYMFYVGINEWQPVPGTNFVMPLNTTVNLATSPDGLDWTKSEDNPILEVSVVQDTPFRIGTIAAQTVGPRIHLWIDDYYPDLDTNAVGYFLYEPGIEPHPAAE